MPQKQGIQSTASGRLDGSIGTALASGDVTLGAGWGDAATLAITSGSNAQRGTLAVTASTTGVDQATATIAVVFPDGAYASTPFLQTKSSTNSAGELDTGRFAVTSLSTTGFTVTYSVLPVDTFVYTLHYKVTA